MAKQLKQCLGINSENICEKAVKISKCLEGRPALVAHFQKVHEME